MLLKSKKAYKQGKYVNRTKLNSYKSRKSKWIVKATKMYNVDNLKPTQKLAKQTGCSVKGLKDIIKKGKGAYYSSGSRPNQTAESWGIARLGSAITGGPSSKYDYHILEKECDKDSKALRLAEKPKNRQKGGSRTPIKKNNYIFFKDFP